MSERPLTVIDLDGVLADLRHRLHHIEGADRDWAAFFAGIPDDPVLAEGVAVVERLAADHDVLYLTGRPERSRGDTERWLTRHGLPRGRLLMRSDRDRRPAKLTKVELLDRQVAAGRVVGVVIDDDPRVCAAMRRRGWPVLVADWMTRSDTLHQAQEDLGAT